MSLTALVGMPTAEGSRIRAAKTLAVAVLVFASGLSASAQGPRMSPIRSRVITPPRVQADRAPHFGVLGAVSRPGVYTASTPTPLLIDVVKQAGELTEDATGNVRIVRGGRTGQQTFYTPNLDYRLQPGDLLVVDSRRRRAGNHRVSDQDAQRQPVQLAFLNVLERPVVLRMRAEDATIARILTLLQQSPDAGSSIRVVETGPDYTRGARDEHTRLADGSILVFDPTALNTSRLPELPPVVNAAKPASAVAEGPAPNTEPRALPATPAEPALPMQPIRRGDVPSQPASLSNVPRVRTPGNPLLSSPHVPLPIATDDGFENDPSDIASRPILSGPAIADVSMSRPVEPRFDEAPATPDNAVSNVPGPSFIDDGPGSATAAIDTATGPDAADQPTTNTADGSVADAENAAATNDTSSLVIVISVLLVAGALIWVLSRRNDHVGSLTLGETEEAVGTPSGPVPSPAPESDTTTAPRARHRIDASHAGHAVPAAHSTAVVRGTLDDLIERRVVFQEEPVSLPNTLEVYGSPAANRHHRVDAGTPPERKGPRRPHLAARIAESIAAESNATATTAAETTPEAATDETAVAGGPDAGRRVGMLDRVLTSVHGATQR